MGHYRSEMSGAEIDRAEKKKQELIEKGYKLIPEALDKFFTVYFVGREIDSHIEYVSVGDFSSHKYASPAGRMLVKNALMGFFE